MRYKRPLYAAPVSLFILLLEFPKTCAKQWSSRVELVECNVVGAEQSISLHSGVCECRMLLPGSRILHVLTYTLIISNSCLTKCQFIPMSPLFHSNIQSLIILHTCHNILLKFNNLNTQNRVFRLSPITTSRRSNQQLSGPHCYKPFPFSCEIVTLESWIRISPPSAAPIPLSSARRSPQLGFDRSRRRTLLSAPDLRSDSVDISAGLPIPHCATTFLALRAPRDSSSPLISSPPQCPSSRGAHGDCPLLRLQGGAQGARMHPVQSFIA